MKRSVVSSAHQLRGWLAGKTIKAVEFDPDEPRPYVRLILEDRYGESEVSMLAQGNYCRSSAPSPCVSTLSGRALLEVLRLSPTEAADILVAVYSFGSRLTVWTRFQSYTFEARDFEVSGDGVEPDLMDAEIIDHGQTLRLGQYEICAKELLREHRERSFLERAQENMDNYGTCLEDDLEK